MGILRDAVNAAYSLTIDSLGRAKVVLDSTQQVVLAATQQVVMKTYMGQVVRGLITGEASQDLKGYNGVIGTAYEPLWAASGSQYPWLAAAQLITVSSDSVSDVYGSGTGAWVVVIYGLDSTYTEITDQLNLNGKTAVTSTKTFLRVNKFVVAAAGSTNGNVGNIYVGYGTVPNTGIPPNILSMIAVGENLSQQAVYTVPALKNWDIRLFSVSSSGQGWVQLRSRLFGSALFYSDNTLPINGVGVIPSEVPKLVPAKTDVYMVAKANSGTIAVGLVFQGVVYVF